MHAYIHSYITGFMISTRILENLHYIANIFEKQSKISKNRKKKYTHQIRQKSVKTNRPYWDFEDALKIIKSTVP